MSVITAVINANMSVKTQLAVLCAPVEMVLNLIATVFPVEVSELTSAFNRRKNLLPY